VYFSNVVIITFLLTTFKDGAENGLWLSGCIVLLEKGICSFVMRQMLKEMVSRLCVTSWFELWSQKEMYPMISIALIHAPTLTSRNGAPWINMEFFAHQYLGILKVVSTEIQPSIIAKLNECGIDFSLWKIPVHKTLFCFTVCIMEPVNDLCGWKCNVFVTLFVEPLTQLFAV